MTPDHPYDLVIIGSGAGGYVAAIRGAQRGLRVAVVENGPLGGTFVNNGCIPAKTLLRHGQVLADVRDAGRFGVITGEVSFDLPRAMARKEEVVHTVRQQVEDRLRALGVDLVWGVGRIAAAPMRIEGPVGSVDALGEVVVQAASGESAALPTRNVLLATGSVPRPLPGLPFDEDRVLSSSGALELAEVPRRLGVIGAGAGGVELAWFYRLAGAEEVLLVEARDQVLPREDAEIGGLVQGNLAALGIRVETGARVDGFAVDGEAGSVSFRLAAAGGEVETVAVDRLLVSIGIRPFTAGLGLDEAGILCDPRGFVVVDEFLRTSAPGVYAVGDVAATPALGNVASAEGILVVEQIAGLPVEPIDYVRVPRGVYSHPEVGSVGLTEEEAREWAAEQGTELRVGRFAYGNNGRAVLMGRTEGLVKVISEARYGEILGIHIFGAHATTLLGEASLALAYEYTAEDLGAADHAYPTLAQVLQEAALDAIGLAIHV